MGTLEVDVRDQFWPRTLSPRLLAAALVVVGGGLVFALGLIAGRPITFPDEVIYNGAARSLSAGQGLVVGGVPVSIWTYGPLYIAILAPIYRLSPDLHTAYLAARAFNALAYTSAAVPIFLIGRRVISKRSATVVAAAGIALPASVYTTKLQTESLAYPATMWAALGTLALLARPTRRRQLVLLALLAAASLVRFELIALVPAAAVACVMRTDGSALARLRRVHLLVGIVIVLLAVGAAVLPATLHGASFIHGLKLQTVSVRAIASQFAGSFAALDLATGLAPLALVFVATFGAWDSEKNDRDFASIRALAVVSLTFAFSLAIVGSVYLAGVPQAWRPSVPVDRYVFYVVPLSFVVVARWLEDGAPTGRHLRWATVLFAALPVVVTAAEVHGPRFGATGSALSLMPWLMLRALTPEPTWIIALIVYCSAVAYLVTRPQVAPRRVVRALGGSVAVLTTFAFGYVALGSWNATLHSPPGGWLDARADGQVVGVWASKPTDRQAFAMWEVQVMNRNLTRVYYVRQPDHLGPETRLARTADGTLLNDGKPVRARFALTGNTTHLAGRLVAERNGLALYEITQPLRIAGTP